MKASILSSLGAAHSVYSTARQTAAVVTHPITWVRDQIKTRLVGAVVELALSTLSDDTKRAVTDKVTNHKKTVSFAIPVPSVLHSTFASSDTPLKLLHQLANDALAAPLALLGYRVGTLGLAWDAEALTVRSTLELGISST